jgi:hypothetical protein
MPPGLTEEQWEVLKRDGALYLPGLIRGDELRRLQESVSALRRDLPYGYVYGTEYSRTTPKKQEAAPPVDPLQVMPVFDSGFMDPVFHEFLAKPEIHDGFERILGKDFVLDNTIVHTVRLGTKRLPFHKDAHGLALAVVLLDKCGWDNGGTSFAPATHINSPPPSYCMEDVRARPSAEGQTVGAAGDVYILCVDAWHGRAANIGPGDTSKLMLHVNSRTNFRAPAWFRRFAPEEVARARAKLPPHARHLLEWSHEETQQRQQELAALGAVKRWAVNRGEGCHSLLRSFVHFLLYANRRDLADARGKTLPGYTSAPMFQTFSFAPYWRALKLKLVLRRLLASAIYAVPGGKALISMARARGFAR